MAQEGIKMIEFLSSSIKSLGVAIIIVSILEMLLPNNKIKKYIRMVMGIFILFNIIAPFIQNKDKFDLNEISLENFTQTETVSSTNVNQVSMNQRIEKLYTQEMEKDITKKVEEKGYVVEDCNVIANIKDEENETKITQIRLSISKKQEQADTNENTNSIEETIENKIVTEIQKIKINPINISKNSEEDIQKTNQDANQNSISKSDIQNLKKFLIEEYGVSEKCLEIN